MAQYEADKVPSCLPLNVNSYKRGYIDGLLLNNSSNKTIKSRCVPVRGECGSALTSVYLNLWLKNMTHD